MMEYPFQYGLHNKNVINEQGVRNKLFLYFVKETRCNMKKKIIGLYSL